MPGDRARIGKTAAGAGLVVGEFAAPAGLPEPMAVWKRFVGLGASPLIRVPDERFDELSEVWLGLATANGTIGADGRFLLSINGSLPWLEVRTGDAPARIDLLCPDGGIQPEFVAMAVDGSAWCSVTPEEYDTWIFADPMIPSIGSS